MREGKKNDVKLFGLDYGGKGGCGEYNTIGQSNMVRYYYDMIGNYSNIQ